MFLHAAYPMQPWFALPVQFWSAATNSYLDMLEQLTATQLQLALGTLADAGEGVAADPGRALAHAIQRAQAGTERMLECQRRVMETCLQAQAAMMRSLSMPAVGAPLQVQVTAAMPSASPSPSVKPALPRNPDLTGPGGSRLH